MTKECRMSTLEWNELNMRAAYENFFNVSFTFTDISVDVECVAFLVTSGFSASDASDADMHNKLQKILK